MLLSFVACARRAPIDRQCVSEARSVEVRGTSLLGLMAPGTMATLLTGAYQCNDPARGDIVAHRYAGNADPVAKVIAALPGDTLRIDACPSSDLPRRCLFIAGSLSKTSTGAPHYLQPSEEALLGEYIRSGAGVVPRNAYLLLSNRPSGTIDSRQFGLVARAELLGPLVMER